MSLLSDGKRYWSAGFNIVAIGGDKKAIGKWKTWKYARQGDGDITALPWESALALAAIAGPTSDDLVCLDFDKAPGLNVLQGALGRLGLPAGYPWAVRSPGKGGGWHIWVRSHGLAGELARHGLDASKTVFEGPYPGADHVELRWNGCYTLLPPSLHPDGRYYEFVGPQPEGAPDEIDPKRLVRLSRWREKREPEREPPKSDGRDHAEDIRLALDRCVDKIERAAERNNALNECAYLMGGMSWAGANRGECERELVAAALRAGLTEHESIATFASGWDSGSDEPVVFKEKEFAAEKPASTQAPAKEAEAADTVGLDEALVYVVRYTKEPLPEGIAYPWPLVNSHAQPMRPGWLSYLAGYTSHGKTAAAIECAVSTAEAGKKVLFVSGEMSPEEIAIRVAQRFGLNTFRFYKGESNQHDHEVAEKARAHDAHKLVRIAYTRKLSGIERLIEQTEPALVIVDYLQFLDIGKGTRLEGTTRNSQALKDLARTCKLPVLCLSQLRRADRTNRDAEPELDDLRDSGSIEQDGDHVIFIWRKEIKKMYDAGHGAFDVHVGKFLVRKARMGRLGASGFEFNPFRQTFKEVPLEES